FFRNASYLDPPGWYAFTVGGQAPRHPPKDSSRAPGQKAPAEPSVVRTSLFQTSPASFADAEGVRETCVSRDGTKVPLNVIRKKGLSLDGKNPTILTGYGGYNVSRVPRFDPVARLWLDRGGVVAIANLRGGGEFGEEWHRAGNLTRKQNVFDDFT